MRQIPVRTAARLMAAAAPISLNGLDNTTIEDIVTATGIPKATLYYYFDGKQDILAFLLEDALREMSEQVAAAAKDVGTGAHRLDAVIAAQLEVMSTRPAVCRALVGELSRAAGMPAVVEMVDAAYLQSVEAVLLAGARDGSLAAQPNPRVAAVALLGAVTAMAMTYLIAEGSVNESSVKDVVRSLVIDGLSPR